MSERTKNRLAR